uniref:Uncharacterized protein n=1 Tax=Cacopsylla melanoneura TaxID=428564 RepID=A0A8D8U0V3_9HEMI
MIIMDSILFLRISVHPIPPVSYSSELVCILFLRISVYPIPPVSYFSEKDFGYPSWERPIPPILCQVHISQVIILGIPIPPIIILIVTGVKQFVVLCLSV